MEFVVHVFVTGSDAEAHNGNPRRFKFSDDPTPLGWTKVSEFKAFRSPIPGTAPIYVSEAGGGAVRPGNDPHRFRAAFDSGVLTGWARDSLIFHAFTSPQPGTVPHYVFQRGGGDPAQGDPSRFDITTNPCPAAGWTTQLVFHAVPSQDVNQMAIHVFTAGDDSRAAQGDPRRANISLDGTGPAHSGWFKVLEFKALRAPTEGSVQYFVSEAGGGATYPGGNPHRFRVDTNSGVQTGWTRDTFTFHAFPRRTAGTVPYFVMERGGGDPAAGDPHRVEITLDNTPLPGWHEKFAFFAWPSLNPSLQSLYKLSAGNDASSHLGDPRRFKFTNVPANENTGWSKECELKVFLSPVPGTTRYFVSDAGGGQVRPGGDPHRYRIGLDTGTTSGWRDQMSFYAYSNPTAGTAKFWVMERGGGDPTAGDAHRCDIVQTAQPAPGWRIRHIFYAYPVATY